MGQFPQEQKDMDAGNLTAAREVLQHQWEVTVSPRPEKDLNWELLLEALEERITDLMINNPRKLTTAVYLLDISERRYQEAMRRPGIAQKARALAEIILERESEKIALRRRYAAEPRKKLEQESSG